MAKQVPEFSYEDIEVFFSENAKGGKFMSKDFNLFACEEGFRFYDVKSSASYVISKEGFDCKSDAAVLLNGYINPLFRDDDLSSFSASEVELLSGDDEQYRQN